MRNADSSYARLQSGAEQECVIILLAKNADSSFARFACKECVICFACKELFLIEKNADS